MSRVFDLLGSVGRSIALLCDGRDLALMVGLGCVAYGVAEIWSGAASATTVGAVLVYVALWHGRPRAPRPDAPKRPVRRRWAG